MAGGPASQNPARKRVMWPSVGMAYTRQASASPDWGRASGVFSTTTSNGAWPSAPGEKNFRASGFGSLTGGSSIQTSYVGRVYLTNAANPKMRTRATAKSVNRCQTTMGGYHYKGCRGGGCRTRD